ncbi:hypothetical protein [Mesobacterium pallidum]|uniref:hypothetical protein n=1 Tax=Mesobacterium pallidum TaxID=2872037 RepID=UPI001EE2B3B9|nr:hypothetical protein [Mesobacterium pallidum]
MPTTIDPVTLETEFNAYFDAMVARVEEKILGSDIPVIGDALRGQVDTLLGFVADWRTALNSVLSTIDFATAELADVAAALDAIDGFHAVEVGGNIAFDVSFGVDTAAVVDLAAAEIAGDLGLPGGGFDLGGTLENLAAAVSSEIAFVIDGTTGALAQDGVADAALNISLTGGIALPETGALGFLGAALEAIPGMDEAIALDFNMTNWINGGGRASVSGGIHYGAHLEAGPGNLDGEAEGITAYLPTIYGDLVMGFDFAGAIMREGATVEATAAIGLENMAMDLAKLAEFLGAIFGQLDDILDTVPLGPLLDILTAELPVLPDLIPGMESDDDGDTIITITDLVDFLPGNAGIDTEFLEQVIFVAELIQTLADLGDGVIPLGDIGVSASASAELAAGTLPDGSAIIDAGSALPTTEPLPQAYLDLLAQLDAGIGLRLPFLETPLESLSAILFNGFGTPTVELVEYDLPVLEFEKGIDIPFYFGPVVAFIGGDFGATIDMGVGYDTSGLGADGVDFAQGFYLATDQGPAGVANPFATLSMTLKAGGGLNVIIGSVTVSGGITGTLGLNLTGSEDGKTYIQELMPCIISDISGTVTAGIEIEFTVGKKPLAISDRFELATVTLAQFNIDPCDSPDMTNRHVGTGLSDVIGATLELNVGGAADERALPRAVDTVGPVELYNPDTVPPELAKIIDTYQKKQLVAEDIAQEAMHENVSITLAPAEDGLGVNRGVAVHAFGIFEVYEAGLDDLATIDASFGEGNDALYIEDAVTLDAEVFGGKGSDTIQGGGGNDTVYGGSDDDVLAGGAGDDVLRGGDGDDILNGEEGADLIDGGAGFDEVDYSEASAGVTLTAVYSGPDFTEYRATGAIEAEGDTLRGIEYIRGSDYDDIFGGNLHAENVLQGNGGNDSLTGGYHADLLSGGVGADTIDGGGPGGGLDDLEDWVSYVFSTAAVWLDFDAGVNFGGEATGDVLIHIENAMLTFHGDTFYGDANTNVVTAFDGDDYIDGRGGLDDIDGGEGEDTVMGYGLGGTFHGGGGLFDGVNSGFNSRDRDLISFQNMTGAVDASLLDGYAVMAGLAPELGDTIAHATLYQDDGAGGVTQVAQGFVSSFEDLTGTAYADTLTGDASENVIRGRNGADSIRGLDGNDTLIGGNGADTLDGDGGQDWVDYSGSGAAVEVDIRDGWGLGGTAEGDVIRDMEHIIGSAYSDTLYGRGVDNIIDPGLFTTGVLETVDGRFGIDTLQLRYALDIFVPVEIRRFTSAEVRVDVLFTPLTNDLIAYSTEQLDIETGDGDDLIAAALDGADEEGWDDYISTGAGDDTIQLGDGYDVVFAGSGDDDVARLSGLAEAFFYSGGLGIDRLSADLSAMVTALEIEGAADGSVSFDIYTDTGAAMVDFELLGDITAGSGDDRLTQLGDHDNAFDGGLGADRFQVDFGDNWIEGGEGNSETGSQADWLTLDFSGVTAFALISDNDIATPTLDVQGVYYVMDGPDTIGSTFFNDIERLRVHGTDNDDEILGITSDETDLSFGDLLIGGGGDDYISGYGDNDTLEGGAGEDSLWGGSGNDWLQGGVQGIADGTDELWGQGGSDTFVLGDASGMHYGEFIGDIAYLYDFDASRDTLQLAGTASDYFFSFSGGDTYIYTADLSGLVGRLLFTLLPSNSTAIDYVPVTPSAPQMLSGTSSMTGSAGAPNAPIIPPGPTPGPIGPTPFDFTSLNNDIMGGAIDNMVEVLYGPGAGGFTGFSVTGGADAGWMRDGPFAMGDGFVLSTGDISELAGENLVDNADGAGLSLAMERGLEFERIGVTADGSVIFRALVPHVPGGINTLTLRDSANLEGEGGIVSGFDLDAVVLSRDFIATQDETVTTFDPALLDGALDVFDYTPAGTAFEAGRMGARVVNLPFPIYGDDLLGTGHGTINEGFARLGQVDYSGDTALGGAFSLGDAGQVTFALTETVDTSEPLYLYVAEAFDNGEELASSVVVSPNVAATGGDLSRDFGSAGAADDAVTVRVDFDVTLPGSYGGVDYRDLFHLVIVSEEFPENRTPLDPDRFEVKINGLSAAVLSDGRQADMTSLAVDLTGAWSEDTLFNLVGEGALRDVLRADAYTQVLTVQGPIFDGANLLELSVADGGDGLLDTAIFLAPVTGVYATGGPVEDRIEGTDLYDQLLGFRDNDTIEGRGGNDTLYGGPGHDSLIGGAGADVLNGGFGDDTASYVETLRLPLGGLVVSLEDPSQNTGSAAGDTYLGVENLETGAGADTLIGDDAGNGLVSGADDDVLYGRGGDDELRGGDGNDALFGEDGADTLYGAGGNDTLTGGAGADELRGGGGIDLVSYADAGAGVVAALANTGINAGDAAGDSYYAVEQLEGSAHADDLRGSGASDTIRGGAGADSLRGNGGTDFLYGGDGHDSLRGGAERDYLYGENGHDLLQGEAGDDWLTGGGGADTLDGGDGTDVASYLTAEAGVTVVMGNMALNTGQAANDVFLSIEGLIGSGFADDLRGDEFANTIAAGVGDDDVLGNNGDDTLFGEGGADTLDGASGADWIEGGFGADLLIGGWGADTLKGDNGNDVIEGDGGADEITGGLGDDTLTGGTQADVFVFDGTQDEGTDTITDFDITADVLRFEGVAMSDLTVIGTFETLIVVDGLTAIVLQGVDSATLTSANYDFV